MNARGGFWPLTGLALLLSAIAAIAHLVLQPWLGATVSVQLLLLALSLVWLLLGLRTAEAGGRALVLLAWCIAAALLVWWQPALWVWLMGLALPLALGQMLGAAGQVHTLAVIVGLQVLALIAALAALKQTHSVFWLCWCWLLLQTLASHWTRSPPDPSAAVAADGFDRARQLAEAALRRMAVR